MNERHEPRSELDDVEVRQVYRALPDEEVPRELDAAVLEAARMAVAGRHRSRWLRWAAPVAAAASLIVVVAIVLDPGARKAAGPEEPVIVHTSHEAAREKASNAQRVVPVEPKVVEPPAIVLDKPEPSAAPPASKAERRGQSVPPAVTSTTSAPAPVAQAQEDAALSYDLSDAATQPSTTPPPTSIRERSETTAGAVAAPPVAAPAKQRRDSAQDKEEEIRVTARSKERAPRAGSFGPRASAVTSAPQSDAAQTRLTEWLQKIHKLEQEGRHERAARELEKLRRAYPDVNVERELELLRKQEQTPAR